MSLRAKPLRNRSSTRRFPIGPIPRLSGLQIAARDRRGSAGTSGCFGVPADQFVVSERTGSLLTVSVSTEKCPLPRTTLRTTDHLDRKTQFGGTPRADDVTDPNLRWVGLDRVAPVRCCHVIRPRRCHHPTRHPAPRADGKHRLLIPCTATALLRLAMTSFSCQANSRTRSAKQCRACALSLATEPPWWVAGGVASKTSRSLSAVVHRAVGADDTPGQCDSSVGPAPAGSTTPSAKEPPMGYAIPAITHGRKTPANSADNCTFVIGCTNCQLRYLR